MEFTARFIFNFKGEYNSQLHKLSPRRRTILLAKVGFDRVAAIINRRIIYLLSYKRIECAARF
jgi:hypothetical protein